MTDRTLIARRWVMPALTAVVDAAGKVGVGASRTDESHLSAALAAEDESGKEVRAFVARAGPKRVLPPHLQGLPKRLLVDNRLMIAGGHDPVIHLIDADVVAAPALCVGDLAHIRRVEEDASDAIRR